jgi:hypothetical protein
MAGTLLREGDILRPSRIMAMAGERVSAPAKKQHHGGAKMNKRFLVSVVALFVASMVTGFVVHGALLGADYARLTTLFRTPEDSQQHFVWMLLAHVFIAVGFTWVYRAGRDSRPWLGQGVRFGLAIAVLSTIPVYLIYFAVQPMPMALVVKQIVFDTVSMVILGIVAAAVNRDPPAARA